MSEEKLMRLREIQNKYDGEDFKNINYDDIDFMIHELLVAWAEIKGFPKKSFYEMANLASVKENE